MLLFTKKARMQRHESVSQNNIISTAGLFSSILFFRKRLDFHSPQATLKGILW